MRRYNLNIKVFLLGMIALASSCNFLDLEPADEFKREDYYEDKNQAEMALAAVYANMADLYDEHLSIWLSAGNDELLHSKIAGTTRGSELSKFTYNAFTVDVKKIWTMSYSLISRANDVIYNIEGRDTISGLSALDKQAIIGEALTLRAMTYLNLVRMYEHIPVRILPFVDIAEENGDLHLGNVEPAEVYNQIIEDLEASVAMLPEEAIAYGRVTKYVAHGLLARTFLHLAGNRTQGGDYGIDECYNRVIEHSEAVINSGKHSLLDNYADVFINQIQQSQDSREVLWEVNFTYTNERNLGGFIGKFNAPKVEGSDNTDPESTPMVFVTPTINQLYGEMYEEIPAENEDTRHGWNVVPYNINYDDGVYSFPGDIGNKLRWYPGKWRRVQRVSTENPDGSITHSALLLETGAINRWHTSINFPLLRYADVLLMKAEAVNYLYGPTLDALDQINAVRLRAGASTVQDYLADQGLGLSQNQLFELIKDERSRELCYEGHRRFDLVRWGILVETMQEQNSLIINHPDYDPSKDEFLTYPGNAVQERHDVFPIPNDEITLNKNVKQHPEW